MTIETSCLCGCTALKGCVVDDLRANLRAEQDGNDERRDEATCLKARLARTEAVVEYAIAMMNSEEDYESDGVIAKLRQALNPREDSKPADCPVCEEPPAMTCDHCGKLVCEQCENAGWEDADICKPCAEEMIADDATKTNPKEDSNDE